MCVISGDGKKSTCCFVHHHSQEAWYHVGSCKCQTGEKTFQNEFSCLTNLPVEDPCFSVLEQSQPQTSHLPGMQRHFSPSSLHVSFHSAIGTAKESSPNLKAPLLLWFCAGLSRKRRT